MPVARDGEHLRVVAGDADRWRGPCLRSPPIPRVRGRYHVLSPTTGRRTPMKHWTDLFKLVVALLTLAVLLPAPAALAGSSADEIKNCPDQNWCAYHRTVDTAWRHSPLTQVNTTNVKRLRPVWIFQPGDPRMGLHSTPLVIDGNMYVSTNPSTVWKLNATTGERIWAYVPKMDDAIVSRSFFGHTRGLAIGDGRVYMGLADGRLVALDEGTGKVIWDRQIVNSKKDTAGFSGAATFVNANLLVMGQNGGEYPVEGKIFGINPKTSSTVALDLNTGKLNWFFQEAPADPYDYDASPGEYVLFDDSQKGKLVLHPGKNGFNHVHDRKTGKPLNVYPDMKSFNWTTGFNLETGKWENMLWPKAGVKTLVCPAIDGGHSWNAGAYSPQTKLFYRIANEWCMDLTVPPKGGGTTITAGSESRIIEPFAQAFMSAEWVGANPPGDTAHGRLTARDPVSGKIAWEKRYDLIPHSALLSTAGGLVFVGTIDGFVEALDAKTGDRLWRFNNGTSHNGGIVSYAVGGKQYIAVATGHGSYVGRALADHYHKDKLLNFKESAAVVVFSLD